jgi:hypothetical protein
MKYATNIPTNVSRVFLRGVQPLFTLKGGGRE